jgi:hypothetical protein
MNNKRAIKKFTFPQTCSSPFDNKGWISSKQIEGVIFFFYLNFYLKVTIFAKKNFK